MAMRYDEHERLGYEHGRLWVPRHQWSDSHLQAAYDRGYYRRAAEPDAPRDGLHSEEDPWPS
jgi:hypothetical protein